MFVVGMTGGIGAGKSTVAELFAKHNVPIIDADIIARKLTEPHQPSLKKIKEHFNEQVINPDGTLNRGIVRKIIFNNPNERRWLEKLLHPLIQKEIIQMIKNLQAPYCIAIIPLLFEAEMYSFINRTLVVDAPKNLQIERIINRDRVSKQEVLAILNSQASRTSRLNRAQDVILNEGETSQLVQQVALLHEKYLKLAEKNM